MPSFRVTIRTVRMDNDILNLTLDVDGQLLRYSHGPQAVQLMSWPGSGGTRRAHAAGHGGRHHLDHGDKRRLGAEPLFDRAALSAGGNSLSRQATFNVDGHRVTLEFTPNSIRNPFQLPGFACP